MNYSIFRFTLNMHNNRSQASVSAFLGDTAIRLLITLADGGNTYAIEPGCVAILSGTKADGKKIWDRCAIIGNTIQYDFNEQTASFPGVVNCEVTLYGADGGVVTAPKFIIVVDEKEFVYEDFSETHVDALNDILQQKANIAVTSALQEAKESGEFKGDKGDKGDSPKRGEDYWTDEDKAEIKYYVEEAIIGGKW